MSVLKNAQIENWAVRAYESIRTGGKEHDGVEVKRLWPDPASAAKRIAGHANQARGNDILWLIGIDETNGAIARDPNAPDFAQWWPQVEKELCGHAPEPILREVQHQDGEFTAIAFKTDRPPYVRRIVGGPVQFEVPWRNGTYTNSANRHQLISLLLPLVEAPVLVPISIDVGFYTNTGDRPISKCNIRAQLVLMTTTPLVLDYNKSAIIVSRAGSGDEFPMSVTKIETIADDNVHSGGRLATIRSSATIRINGLSNQSLRDFATDELKISLGLGAVHGSGPLGIGPFKLIEQPGEQPHKKEWTAEI